MAYPIGATTFTKEAWHKLGSCIHQAVLPKAGIVRTLQLDVLYGPDKYQGTGHHHWWHEQELAHLYDFVDELNRSGPCAARYQATTKQLRLETGYSGPFTAVPYKILAPLTTDCWIKTLWSYCHHHDITIKDSFGDLAPL